MESTFTKARRLRRDMTLPERLVWRRLRGRGLGGFKFRRQVPIGPLIADFVCAQAKLIIEVDGDSHDSRQDYDARRTAYLNKAGYRVLRLTNAQVRAELGAALCFVLDELKAPSPGLSPINGGEG